MDRKPVLWALPWHVEKNRLGDLVIYDAELEVVCTMRDTADSDWDNAHSIVAFANATMAPPAHSIVAFANATMAPPVRPVCLECGSFAITRDASAIWDDNAKAWVLSGLQDAIYCEHCDEQV